MGDTLVVVLAALSAVSSVGALVALRILARPCACERLAAEIDATTARTREVRRVAENILRDLG